MCEEYLHMVQTKAMTIELFDNNQMSPSESLLYTTNSTYTYAYYVLYTVLSAIICGTITLEPHTSMVVILITLIRCAFIL